MLKQCHVEAYAQVVSPYTKEVLSAALAKVKLWEKFLDSKNSCVSQEFLGEMKKTCLFTKRKQASAARADQEVSKLIERGKLPNMKQDEFRKLFSNKAIAFLEKVIPTMRKILRGCKKTMNLSKLEQKLVSGAVLVLLICLSRPARGIDLLSLTESNISELLQKEIIYFVTRKASCKTSTAFLSIQTCAKTLSKYLRVLQEVISPYLRLGGKTVPTKKVQHSDLLLIQPFVEMSKQDFLATQLNNGSKSVNKRNQRFVEGWLQVEHQVKTKNLTLAQLRRAYLRDTSLCPHVFVNHDGQRMSDIGCAFLACAKEWMGVELTLTLFRKYLDTSFADPCISSTGLNHTPLIADKHYKLCDMQTAVAQWNAAYTLDKEENSDEDEDSHEPSTPTVVKQQTSTPPPKPAYVDLQQLCADVQQATNPNNGRTSWYSVARLPPYNAYTGEQLRTMYRNSKKRKRLEF